MKILLIAVSLTSLMSAGEVRRASSAEVPVHQPVMGYVVYHDPLQLRPIFGIPGAARLGDPVELPANVADVHVAPGHGIALLITEASVGVLSLDGSRDTVWIETARPGEITFSPAGSAAVLRTAAQAVVLTGLGDSPRIARSLTLPAEPVKLAVSDDGDRILMHAGDLWFLEQDQPRLMPALPGAAGPIAFTPGSHDAFVAAGSAVFRVSDTGAMVPFIAASDELPSWTSVSVGADSLLLVSADHNAAWRASLSNGAILQRLDLPVAPARLERLGAGSRFLYAASPGEPAWILLAAGSEFQSYFVPAVAQAVEAAQ